MGSVDDLLEVFRYHETVGKAYNCFIKNLNNAWKGFFKFHNKSLDDVNGVYNLFRYICIIVRNNTKVVEPIRILNERKGLNITINKVVNRDKFMVFVDRFILPLEDRDIRIITGALIRFITSEDTVEKGFAHDIESKSAKFHLEMTRSNKSSGTDNMVRYNDNPSNYADIKLSTIKEDDSVYDIMEYKCFSIYGLLALCSYMYL